MADQNNFGRVAVLMGGRSAEREVSLMSGQGVLTALKARGVDAFSFDPSERPCDDLKREGAQRAFICLHGRYGEDGTIQGALELLDIPYTGSGVMASAIAIDKVTTKRVWSAQSIPTPAYKIVRSATQLKECAELFGLPLAVKPAREGSSLGFTKLESLDQAELAFERAAALDDVLVEQFVSGRELTVTILGTGSDARALPIIEIVAPAGEYDFQNKYYTDTTQYHCPAKLPDALAQQIAQVCVEAYRSLGCAGWGRVDVMLRASDNAPFLLEVNTSPGMTSHSLVPMAAKATGMAYEDLVLHVLADARLHLRSGGTQARGGLI
jgi:D-alanine-D-alanine ligase